AEHLIGHNASAEIDYTVFCSSKDLHEHPERYKNARLRYVGLHANGKQSIPYDIISMLRCLWRGYDVLLILGVSGCYFLPILRLLYWGKIIVNIDGLEHRRAKWSRPARFVLRTSEAVAVRFANVVIADNKGISDYVEETYGRRAEMVAYGGDHVFRTVDEAFCTSTLETYGLTRSSYAIGVCRIVPENNCHVVLEAFARTGQTLVFVGNWQSSDYGRNLREQYSGRANIHMLDAIYDLDVLYVLRSNAGLYVHGHSAGGTNPSLVEAMFFGIPILAFDVVYNRETTDGKAWYFAGTESLVAELSRASDERAAMGAQMLSLARERYTWHSIVKQYEALYDK
ncbi:MAG: DUF1972 domain-containing protein, partial [Candidatus Limisoma sp.]